MFVKTCTTLPWDRDIPLLMTWSYPNKHIVSRKYAMFKIASVLLP